VIQPKRHPYLLPHERYLTNRFYKKQAESKMQRRGPESAALYVAYSADTVLAWPFVLSAVIVGTIGDIDESSLAYAAVVLFGAAICMYLLAMVRLTQSISARHRYQRSLDSGHMTG
jgi:hypothetical protein